MNYKGELSGFFKLSCEIGLPKCLRHLMVNGKIRTASAAAPHAAAAQPVELEQLLATEKYSVGLEICNYLR